MLVVSLADDHKDLNIFTIFLSEGFSRGRRGLKTRPYGPRPIRKSVH